MGTDLENVLEDIKALMDHFKYFAECKGNLTPKMRSEIEIHREAMEIFAKLIQETSRAEIPR